MSASRVRVERTFETSSVLGTHATGLRTVIKSGIAPSANAIRRGTMIIMALTMTSLTDVVLHLEDVMNEGSSLSLTI
jgi:hypothetical protein